MTQLDPHENRSRDYGSIARIGVLTPQANPTVEPEMGLLFPAGISMLVSRCTSRAEPRQRFLDYFRQLDHTLQSFDTLQLDAAGFACTASSYLLDEGEEEQGCEALENQFGYPLITAASAIREALAFLGAQKIALACPYPDWLLQLADEYWRKQGFEVVRSFSAQPDMADTRAIYEVRGAAAIQKISPALEGVKADVIVITGTGMPGLRAICELQKIVQVPVINSNLALAWSCLRRCRAPLNERSAESDFPLMGGWERELIRL